MSNLRDALNLVADRHAPPTPPPFAVILARARGRRTRRQLAAGVMGVGALAAIAAVALGRFDPDERNVLRPVSETPSSSAPTGSLAECDLARLPVVMRWAATEAGGLYGALSLTNNGSDPCRLTRTPVFTPVAESGEELPVRVVILGDGPHGLPVLEPGQTARALIHWNSWCGAAASGQFRVQGTSGSQVVAVNGPAQPVCIPGGASNLSSSWFFGSDSPYYPAESPSPGQ